MIPRIALYNTGMHSCKICCSPFPIPLNADTLHDQSLTHSKLARKAVLDAMLGRIYGISDLQDVNLSPILEIDYQ